jgi:hypothetical protein
MGRSGAFVLGTITGAVIAWLWAREVEGYLTDRTRGVRARAADGMRAVEEQTTRALDRSGKSLHRAEEFLQGTKQHVSDALRAGQDAIRPTPTSAEAVE